MKLVNTSYGLSGEELNRRNGAIALNALMATLRSMGRDQQPILDRDYQIYTIIHSGLNGLNVGDVADSSVGSLVSSSQSERNPELDQIGSGIANALGLLDDKIAA